MNVNASLGRTSVIPVIYSATHARHAPQMEVSGGRPVPALEVVERAEAIRSALTGAGGYEFVEPRHHGLDPILAVHDESLVGFLETASAESHVAEQSRSAFRPRPPASIGPWAGHWAFDMGTPVLAGTYEAARSAVDVAVTVGEMVLAGARMAYGLCRPPGHHAGTSFFGGYCYLNNAAIAADWLVRQTGEVVPILDLDFHHGNGTQQIFYSRPDVRYVSLHADPRRTYPYFGGYAEERGAGPGRGANRNLPLPPGTAEPGYLAALDEALDWVDRVPGPVMVVSLGFDTYETDPIGTFRLTTSAYDRIGERVAASGRRLVILQEGGYFVPDLGTNAVAWLNAAALHEHPPMPTDADPARRRRTP